MEVSAAAEAAAAAVNAYDPSVGQKTDVPKCQFIMQKTVCPLDNHHLNEAACPRKILLNTCILGLGWSHCVRSACQACKKLNGGRQTEERFLLHFNLVNKSSHF